MHGATVKISSMCLFLFITLYMFRAHSANHQERQIVSTQPLATVILCWWPRCVQVGRRLIEHIEENLCIMFVIHQELLRYLQNSLHHLHGQIMSTGFNIWS